MKNEKSTFCVLFYLKKDKMKKNGLVPIHARITKAELHAGRHQSQYPFTLPQPVNA